jgi:winged helix DNA-binding protein
MPDPDRQARRLGLVTNRAIAHARLRNSHLVGPRLATPAEVVGWFGAVQSQDVPGALWGIAQRMASSQRIDELGAAMDDGRILRTHALRPTWHFLLPAELRWIQALTSHRVHQVNGTMYRRLGLVGDAFDRADAVLCEVLAGGRALTRDEIRQALATAGIDVGESLVTTHITMHAELEALIANGPRRGRQATYMLVDDRAPQVAPMARADALRELTIRYFQSHGPALAHDMAWWSGLTVGSVREGIALAGGSLEGRRVDGKDFWAAAGAFDPEPGLVGDDAVLLLPNYDEALGSYVDYSPMLEDDLPRARNVGDVLGTHLVVRDGLVVGGWRRTLGRDRVTLTATLLRPFAPSQFDALAAAADRFGAFVGLPVVLEVRAA